MMIVVILIVEFPYLGIEKFFLAYYEQNPDFFLKLATEDPRITWILELWKN